MPWLNPLPELTNGIKHDMDMYIPASVVTIRMGGNDSLMSRGEHTDPALPKLHRLIYRDVILRCEADDIVVCFYILRRVVLPKTAVNINTVSTEVIHIAVESLNPIVLPFDISCLLVQERLVRPLVVLAGEILDSCVIKAVLHRYMFDDCHSGSSLLSSAFFFSIYHFRHRLAFPPHISSSAIITRNFRSINSRTASSASPASW